MLDKYKVILWDFDGVILDSMAVRDRGFSEVLKDYPNAQVDELLTFHRQNGGLSRYVKFRYFFEKIRQESVSEEEVQLLAVRFSEIMLSLLIDEKLLIQDSCSFIKQKYDLYRMHIVSGSDGNELRKICDELKLSVYFHSIEGSPTPKIELVRALLDRNSYGKNEVVLIGDSKNDYEACDKNGIDFYGYNNELLLELSSNYIHSLNNNL